MKSDGLLVFQQVGSYMCLQFNVDDRHWFGHNCCVMDISMKTLIWHCYIWCPMLDCLPLTREQSSSWSRLVVYRFSAGPLFDIFLLYSGEKLVLISRVFELYRARVKLSSFVLLSRFYCLFAMRMYYEGWSEYENWLGLEWQASSTRKLTMLIAPKLNESISSFSKSMGLHFNACRNPNHN